MDDLYEFFDDEINKFEALQNGMLELEAIWIKGKIRVAKNDLIIIDDEDNISKDGGFATHKCIGCYGTIGDTKHELIVIDIITNEPKTILL